MAAAQHVTLPELMISYAGDDRLEVLSVSCWTLERPVMFLWRDDMPARVEEVIRDHAFNAEITQPFPLASFPVAAVSTQIRNHAGEFPGDIASQIIRVLEANCR